MWRNRRQHKYFCLFVSANENGRQNKLLFCLSSIWTNTFGNWDKCILDKHIWQLGQIHFEFKLIYFAIWTNTLDKKLVEGSNIHHICRGRCEHCPWSKKFHVEQFCSTGKLLMVMWNKIAFHNKQSCSTWQNCLLCGVILWLQINDKLLLVKNFPACDKFTVYAFCNDLRCFDAKLILLRFSHFCVEQKINKNQFSPDASWKFWRFKGGQKMTFHQWL